MNSERNLEKVRERYNEGKKEANIKRGDRVLLKKSAREPLDPRFEGLYEVLEARGPNLKLKMGTKRKWHHISRCRSYLYGTTVITSATNGDESRDRVGTNTPNANEEIVGIEQNAVSQEVVVPSNAAGETEPKGKQVYIHEDTHKNEETATILWRGNPME